ncbi:DinB family protein [Chitinophaga sp. sic0106]|uniref:DinB family protein n=1 Tax=Chitinophaga sp. sic0106 TaxID=2854785 RepID=UPI001C44C20A|nr:DinB family protein [Chitinophaga sp. sic0106]MBV7530008.1 DinB family protein [Chitinophaga sp. sic0106]
MLNNILPALFEAEINKLEEEIRLYKSDEEVWKVLPGTSNSGGTLCLHLCGNLRHFIGVGFGNTGYVRDRPFEFSARDLTREVLLEAIADTRTMLAKVLPTLDPAQMDTDFKDNPMQVPMTYGAFVVHLYGHMRYHLGQINYHRRISS